MGNTLKSHLPLRKKKDRPARNENESSTIETKNPGLTPIDQGIINAPNRVRAVGATTSDSVTVSTTPRGIDTPPPPPTTSRTRT